MRGADLRSATRTRKAEWRGAKRVADVVVVDDDSTLAEAVGDILESEGHTVRLASNGEEALRLLALRLPDLIVLDIDMPVLSGPQMAARCIVEDAGREDIPIVIVSGVANLREVAFVVGTPYALPKPCAVESLIATTRKALMERIAPRPPSASPELRP
jgi:CheY-like chemotaxis protein